MRTSLLVVVTLGALAALSSSARANVPGGIIIPPAQVDVGAFAPAGEATALAGPAVEVLAGFHWASMYWKPTRFDVGVGYVGSFRTLDRGYQLAKRETMKLDDELRLHGMYIQLGRTLVQQRHHRTWIAARGELMRSAGMGTNFSASGAALRIASELYAAGAWGGGNSTGGGAVAGTFAIGVYVEASYRDVPSELGSGGVATGITMRIPFIAVIAK